MKTSSGKVVATSFPYPTIHRSIAGDVPIYLKLGMRQFQVDGDVARNRSMDRWIGELCSYNIAAGSFHTKKLCSRLFREKLNFTGINSDIAFLCHPLRDLVVTHRVHLWLDGKCIVDFLLAISEFFSLALMAAALLSKICRNRHFPTGVGHFVHNC